MEEAALLAVLRDARFCEGAVCPRCGCRRVIRWGGFRGRQRYRCRGCGRTFSDLTGTPLAYTKRLGLWPAYGRCMERCETVRRAGAALGIDPQTAWRWRQRLLAALRAGSATATRLGGLVELAETRLPYSEKGRRGSRTPGRRRGATLGDESVPWVWVVLARDRRGRCAREVAGVGRPAGWRVVQLLGERLEAGGTLLTRAGRFSAFGVLAVRGGHELRRVRGVGWGRIEEGGGRSRRRGVGGSRLEHVAHVHALGRRLARWLTRFRGVATRYLERYLAWHDVVDARRAGLAGEGWLQWPLAQTARAVAPRSTA